MSNTCPLCDGNAPALFCANVWKGHQRVMQCPECEAYFLDPQMSVAEQREFDRNYDRYIEARAKVVGKHSGKSFDEHVSDSIVERFGDLQHWFPPGLSILEIGAENGGFLDLVAPTAGQTLAVDSCPEYVAALRGKGYVTYPYIENVPVSNKFQRICLFSLLEHIARPQEFLQEIRQRLATDGYLIVEIPLAREPLVALYDLAAFKSFYFQPMHPYVYSEKAVKLTLGRAGFEVECVQYKQRYGLANHLQWLTVGKPGGNRLFERLFEGPANDEYKKALEKNGCTDTVYIVAKATAITAKN
jgi:SAM-dependent methyltransferase